MVHESELAVVTASVEGAEIREHLDGKLDAGGPYGGPNTFEGEPLTITVTPLDPSIIFFRWDFNNDSLFDYPDQAGASSMGRWTTVQTVTRTYNDNMFGELVVEGWDGVSTRVKIETGDNLAERTDMEYMIGFGGYNFAWQFRAEKDYTITNLGHYHHPFNVFDQGLWASGTLLGSCEGRHLPDQWNWCKLPKSVRIHKGENYRISIRAESWYWAISTPEDTSRTSFRGAFYCFNPTTLCFPSTYWTHAFIPLIDFRWQDFSVLPDTVRDTAFVEVNNVAPTVLGIASDPSPAPEGEAVTLTGSFNDPGLDDTWESRWTFADGSDTGWQPIPKVTGGARVLVLHSWTGDIESIQKGIRAECGTFCHVVDARDFGPLGEDRLPDIDELAAYDVLVVGTNWGPINLSIGDRLAAYMDGAGSVGGGIVMMNFGFYDHYLWGIGGRWETEKSPMPRARPGGSFGGNVSLGTIYVPDHPILDGVSSLNSGWPLNIRNVTSGATRIADWSDGSVFAATKADAGGRLACGLNFFPAILVGGDHFRVIANAIRYCSRLPDPEIKTMPFDLRLHHAFSDDTPSTATHEDATLVRVEVRDDDHGKRESSSGVLVYRETFEDPSQCEWTVDGALWPPGWTAQPTTGWRCREDSTLGSRGGTIWYFYNDPSYGTGDGNSYVYTPTFDMSAFDGVRFEWYNYWQGNYPMGSSDGYLQASVDGGATWTTLEEYHGNNPATDRGDRSLEWDLLGGSSNVVFRFYYVSDDDWWWFFDNVAVFGLTGEIMDGLGSTNGTVTVRNMDPIVTGGFDTAQRDPNGDVVFKGFRIQDPALWEPTEWFAYAWDFGDGSPVRWEYNGNMTPPKFDVLLLHSMCLSGDSCAEYTSLRNTMLSLDDVAKVDGYNFLNQSGIPRAPDLGLLLPYDVLVVAMNWGYVAYPPWDLTRRQVGNRLAQYLDSDAGGVVTLMTALDLTLQAGDYLSLAGRYVEDDYGPFEKVSVAVGDSSLGTLLDADHDMFVRLSPAEVRTSNVHSGDYRITVGGRGEAAGRDGVLLARWSDGNSAVGAKELNNGRRTVHLGVHGRIVGEDTPQLLRNAIGWAAGGIPSPILPPIAHQFGNSPPYTVDLMVIDDDMGWSWDPVLGIPIEVIAPPVIGHRYIIII